LRDEALALGPGAVGVGVAAGGVREEGPDDVGHLLQSAERADDRGLKSSASVTLVRPTRSCVTFFKTHSSGLSCGE
jgi:hypothetical protein